MKENRLIYLNEKPAEGGAAAESREQPKEADAAQKAEVQKTWNPETPEGECGDGYCKIPNPEGRPDPVEADEKLDPRWTKVNINDLDKTAKMGAIVLIGASWCSACKGAKKELPEKYPDRQLVYVDYDTNSKVVDEKFPDMGGELPGQYQKVFGSSYLKMA